MHIIDMHRTYIVFFFNILFYQTLIKMVIGSIVDKEEATKFTMAWLRATDDPLVGTDQDSETFQTKVDGCKTSDDCTCWTEAFGMK